MQRSVLYSSLHFAIPHLTHHSRFEKDFPPTILQYIKHCNTYLPPSLLFHHCHLIAHAQQSSFSIRKVQNHVIFLHPSSTLLMLTLYIYIYRKSSSSSGYNIAFRLCQYAVPVYVTHSQFANVVTDSMTAPIRMMTTSMKALHGI